MGFTWLALGDSITFGTGATNSMGYVQLTRKLLKKDKKNHYLINQGVPSITAQGEYDKYLKSLTKIDPDVVTIMLGMNDMATSLSAYGTTIRNLIDDIRGNQGNAKVKIFLCTVTWRNDSSDSIVQTLNTELTSIATEKKVTLVNTRDAYSAASSLSDVVHPNDTGHQQIANILAPAISAAM